jgi:hypothetical protein
MAWKLVDAHTYTVLSVDYLFSIWFFLLRIFFVIVCRAEREFTWERRDVLPVPEGDHRWQGSFTLDSLAPASRYHHGCQTFLLFIPYRYHEIGA